LNFTYVPDPEQITFYPVYIDFVFEAKITNLNTSNIRLIFTVVLTDVVDTFNEFGSLELFLVNNDLPDRVSKLICKVI
jgi:hypothetical protein